MKKLGEIERMVGDFLYLSEGHAPYIRRKLRALVRKAETNAFKCGMQAATANPQWRVYKPFLDRFFKGK